MVHPGVRIIHLQGRTRRGVRVRAKIEQAISRFAYFRKHHPGQHVALRLLSPLKSLLETGAWGIATVASLGLWGRARRRLSESAAVLGWQLLFCPRRLGLDRRAPARGADLQHV